MQAKEFGLTPVQVKQIIAAYNDLKEQADFYGMEIDLETVNLIPKRTFHRPNWYIRWMENRDRLDFNEATDMERE